MRRGWGHCKFVRIYRDIIPGTGAEPGFGARGSVAFTKKNPHKY